LAVLIFFGICGEDMADLIKLCKTQDVAPGQSLQVDADGLPALAVYNLDGEYYVSNNMCTHGMAWMTDGYVEGDESSVRSTAAGSISEPASRRRFLAWCRCRPMRCRWWATRCASSGRRPERRVAQEATR